MHLKSQMANDVKTKYFWLSSFVHMTIECNLFWILHKNISNTGITFTFLSLDPWTKNDTCQKIFHVSEWFSLFFERAKKDFGFHVGHLCNCELAPPQKTCQMLTSISHLCALQHFFDLNIILVWHLNIILVHRSLKFDQTWLAETFQMLTSIYHLTASPESFSWSLTNTQINPNIITITVPIIPIIITIDSINNHHHLDPHLFYSKFWQHREVVGKRPPA